MTSIPLFVWILILLAVVVLGFFTWFMIVLTRAILSIFLNLPIAAEPFRREEGILHYSVNLKSRDGVSIKGFFLPGENAQGRTVVFCHEIGAGAASFQKYAYFLRDRGFNIFTFDFRGHGLSGNVKGYTPRQWATNHEMKDLRTVLNHLQQRKDVDSKRIGLFGISKGGGIALVVAAKRHGAKAVVTDGAFSTGFTVVDYIRKWVPIYLPVSIFPKCFYWFLRVWILWVVPKKMKCRFPSVEKAISNLNSTALLLIHGERDNYISVDQAKRLFKLAKGENKELWIVPKARHNESVKIDPEEYTYRVSAFFEKHL